MPPPMKEIRIVDQTLRDAHQSLWATRMSAAMMLPVLDKIDRIGFDSVDVPTGGVHVDVSVRFLQEDPWQKIRLLCKGLTRSQPYGTIRNRSGTSFDVIPPDIPLLWVERLIANGVRRFRMYDALFDQAIIIEQLKYAKSLGAFTVGALAYGLSPIHTDELYAEKARELIDLADVDAIMLKDAAGLLTPDRIRTLVPALKKVMGDRPLELHSHCITGLAPLVYIEGVRLGVDQIHTSIAPLANGAGQPATQTMVRNLRSLGYKLDVDDQLIDEVGEHFRKVALQEGKPLGKPMEYDAFHFEHQVPGGMQSNFKAQLEQAGIYDKLDAVLHECVQIRRELGWPIMITPFSQFVGTQAVLNVMSGERYKVIPDEIKKYALGYYGKLLAPVEPNVLDKIIDNGSSRIALKPEEPGPGVPALRKRFPNMSDEERLLRHSYAGTQVDDMFAKGPLKTEYRFDLPAVSLFKELMKRPTLARVFIQKKDFLIDIRR